MDVQKIEAINSLEIVDWSCSNGECEYIHVADTPENRQTLLDSGFTEEQLHLREVKSDPDDGVLDVSYLAFNYAGANWFNQIYGFSENGEE